MKCLPVIFLLILWLSSSLSAAEGEILLDSNVAFYQGESLSYIVYPPSGYRMVEEEAAADGYSFAFVPWQSRYDEADLMIGVNIYKIRGMTFEEVLGQDTSSLREHYGKDMLIRPVDSVLSATRAVIPTFYTDDKRQFIPNVMLSYFDGSTEVVIFELVITDRALRYKAEEVFINCLRKFKALKIGELGHE